MDGLDGKKLPKIKPCPFCGSEVRIYDFGKHGYGIGCTKNGCICYAWERGCSLLFMNPNPEVMIKKWNKRPRERRKT